MINVSNEFKQQLAKDNRRYFEYVDITLKDRNVLNLTNENLWDGGMEIEDAVSDESSFNIGSAIINKCSLTIDNIYDDFTDYVFEDAEVVTYIGLELPDGTIEKIRKGTFTVDESQYNGSILSLSCLDNMRKFDRAYSESTLAYPATLNAIVRDACSVCSVTLQTVSFPHDAFVVQIRPTDEAVTFREVISWAAQIAGCFCRCDVYGRLELKWYDQAALENPTVIDWSADNPTSTENAHWIKSNYSASDVGLDDVVITGIRIVEKNESEESQEELTTYQSGSDGYVISIENNELVKNGAGQTVAGWLGEQLIGVKFRKAVANHASDPTIEAGDVAKLTDRKGNNYNIVISSTKFSTGSSQNTVSAAETPVRNSAKRYSALTKNYVEWRKAIQKEKTEREKALEELGERLENSAGVFTTIEIQSDGSKIYYLHNKPNLSESDMVWKMTSEAWGVSTDGGKTWNAGMTVDGDTIVRILSAEGVNANWINAGAITVKDNAGDIIFSVDMDTKTVLISGDSIRIGDKSATTVINELETKIGDSVALVMSLDNEYQGIPTDYEGNYNTFPEVKTTVTVLHGHMDVSADCSYSTAKSAEVTGTWSSATRTYTVTALAADTGWVDITATYLSLYIVTKRFNLAKVKGGAPGAQGAAGRTYFIEPSTTIIKYAKDNSVSPNYVEFKAYYRDGFSTARTPYAGRFVIEESDDGDTWTTMYTSDEDEAEIFHSMYNVLADSYLLSKRIIVTHTGQAILIQPRHPLCARCTLYAAGGTTTALDMQSVIAVKDVDALTHEEIFNLLTNGGAAKGIYKEGNQLYISFTYAKGGELGLGGPGNGNGVLKVFDSAGTEIGTIDNTMIKHLNPSSGRSTYLKNGALYLALNDEICGRIGAFYWGNDPEQEGTTYLTNKKYLGIGYYTESGTAASSIVINNGLNPDGYTERIIFYGDSKFRDKATFLSLLEANGIDNQGNLTINQGNLTITRDNTTETRVNIANDIHSGRVVAGAGGNFGLYDVTNGKWIIYSNSAGEICLPTGILPMGSIAWSNGSKIEAITYNSAPALRITDGGFYARGDIGCSGTKYRVVETEHYGDIGMNAMESASPYFTDIGSGTVGESGKVTIFHDPIFAETVDMKAEYQVFLTRTSALETSYVEKCEGYFAVHGEPGATFDWMLCAKQRDYSASRLERVNIDSETEVEFDESIFARDNIPVQILEEALDQYEQEVNLL